VIAIGASTGGVQALTQILPMFPPDGPPVLVVQHMPQGFTAAFARRLATICRANVREAVEGERLERGTVLIAPGGPAHMQIRSLRGGGLGVALTPGAPVCYSRPSIDVLFTSVAAAIGARAAAAILTGMGRDGAEGMGLIRRAGGLTLAQEASGCIVNGMPQAAWDLGAAMERLPLESIPDRLLAGQPLAPAHPTFSRMHTLRSGADHG
jgi:two-component system chemotaxis response regulator CheB